jgi:DNA-binding CsgD family transcriptional regulator
MNLTGPVVTCRYGHSVVRRKSSELSPSERAVPDDQQDGPVRVPATVDLAETALRAGLALAVVMAATDCVFALVAGAGALAAIQGVVLVAVGLAGVIRIDVAARLLRPKGRVVLLAGLFAAGGVLDAGLYEHFGGVAGALVCIAALVCAPRWVALCLAVCTAGYLGGLVLHGSSLAWMLGAGRYAIAGHLVNFAGNGGVGLLMVALLRRFLAGAPLRVAAVRAGGRSLTPQLALAASGRQVVALLATGRVPKQAARDLTIALATVRSRISSAKRKTGARTLDQLVAMYAEAELAA